MVDDDEKVNYANILHSWMGRKVEMKLIKQHLNMISELNVAAVLIKEPCHEWKFTWKIVTHAPKQFNERTVLEAFYYSQI